LGVLGIGLVIGGELEGWRGGLERLGEGRGREEETAGEERGWGSSEQESGGKYCGFLMGVWWVWGVGG